MIARMIPLAAILSVVSTMAMAGESAPANPEVPNPIAQEAPSTKPLPGDLLEKSARDLAHGNVAAAAHDDATALRRGPLLIHGNYCGVGNRPGTPPIDLLDAACMRHDACTKTNTLPTCTCNARLRSEAAAIAQDPRTPADVKVLAATMTASMGILICR